MIEIFEQLGLYAVALIIADAGWAILIAKDINFTSTAVRREFMLNTLFTTRPRPGKKPAALVALLTLAALIATGVVTRQAALGVAALSFISAYAGFHLMLRVRRLAQSRKGDYAAQAIASVSREIAQRK